MYLRNRFVLGASEWLAGKYGSKRNDKNILDYTDDEWAYIWSTMLEDRAWAVPPIKDNFGNIIKQNFAPEMMIKFIAHVLKCHIVVFDLLLELEANNDDRTPPRMSGNSPSAMSDDSEKEKIEDNSQNGTEKETFKIKDLWARQCKEQSILNINVFSQYSKINDICQSQSMEKNEKREYFQEIKRQRSLKQRKGTVSVEPVKRFKDMNAEEKRIYFNQKKRELRAKKKSIDPECFAKEIRDEKRRQRTEKKSNDQEEYRRKESEGKKKRRANVLSEENNRRKLFIDSIKDGRIYECISCHREWRNYSS